MALRIRVPGKAILAGEYAVLAGTPAIVAAVDRYLFVDAEPAAKFSVEGAGARWEDGGPDVAALAFAKSALDVTRRYFEGKGWAVVTGRLSIDDELRMEDGRKLGLGGSACTCVGVVGAVAALAQKKLEKPVHFALAAVAHARAQASVGSALDVAASTFGGVLYTRRFDARGPVATYAAGPQPFAVAIDHAELPERDVLPSPPLALVYSGAPASTSGLVGQIEKFRAREPKLFADFMARTAAATDRLRRALLDEDIGAARTALTDAGALLRKLGDDAGVDLVTRAHRTIEVEAAKFGSAAKISGAGGGDCSIALGEPGGLRALARALPDVYVVAVDTEGVRVDG